MFLRQVFVVLSLVLLVLLLIIGFLDSGANNHFFPLLSSFTLVYKIRPISVDLPNGSSILVQHAGNIFFLQNHFSQGLIFYNFQTQSHFSFKVMQITFLFSAIYIR